MFFFYRILVSIKCSIEIDAVHCQKRTNERKPTQLFIYVCFRARALVRVFFCHDKRDLDIHYLGCGVERDVMCFGTKCAMKRNINFNRFETNLKLNWYREARDASSVFCVYQIPSRNEIALEIDKNGNIAFASQFVRSIYLLAIRIWTQRALQSTPFACRNAIYI